MKDAHYCCYFFHFIFFIHSKLRYEFAVRLWLCERFKRKRNDRWERRPCWERQTRGLPAQNDWRNRKPELESKIKSNFLISDMDAAVVIDSRGLGPCR